MRSADSRILNRISSPMGVFGFQVDKEEVKSTTSSFGARKARVSISTLKGSGLKPFGSMTSMVTSITPSTVFLSEIIVYDEASSLAPGGCRAWPWRNPSQSICCTTY